MVSSSTSHIPEDDSTQHKRRARTINRSPLVESIEKTRYIQSSGFLFSFTSLPYHFLKLKKKNITTIKLLFSNEIRSTPPIENGVLKRVSCQSWNSKVSGASKSSLRYNDSFFKITM